jgi:hypothetical protein
VPCKGQIPHLNALHAQKAEEGLVVVGVTGEAADEVQAYVEQNGVQHPIGIGYSEDYDVRGIPHAFLVDKEGKIAWRGHPASLDVTLLARLLEGAKPAGVARGLEDVFARRKAGDHGGAHQKAAELLAAGSLSARASAQAKEWMQAMEQFVAKSLAEADAAAAAKDVYLLWSKLEPLATGYKGVPGAEPAKARFDALMADAKNVKEVEAGKKLAAGNALEQALDFDGAHAIYKALAGSHGSTQAGKAAAVAWKALEKDGKLGYRADCGYCKAGGVACPQHRKKKK